MNGWILLTAAVVPSPHSHVTLTDPDSRLRQYQESIAFWHHASSAMGRRLAVVESSGTPRSTLIGLVDRLSRHSIVTQTVKAPNEVENQGKGASEAFMIDAFVAQLGASDLSAYKVTGRLRVTNYRESMQVVQPSTVVVRMTLNRAYADTRVLGASIDVWKRELNAMYDDVDEGRGVWLEHVVASRLAAAHALKRLNVERFNRRPRLQGMSGTHALTMYGGRRLGDFPGLNCVERAFHAFAARKQV